MSKERRNFKPEFKAQVVLELLREEKTLNELAAVYQISPVVISRWKAEFMDLAAEVFKTGPSEAEKVLIEKEDEIVDLHRKVGQCPDRTFLPNLHV